MGLLVVELRKDWWIHNYPHSIYQQSIKKKDYLENLGFLYHDTELEIDDLSILSQLHEVLVDDDIMAIRIDKDSSVMEIIIEEFENLKICKNPSMGYYRWTGEDALFIYDHI